MRLTDRSLTCKSRIIIKRNPHSSGIPNNGTVSLAVQILHIF